MGKSADGQEATDEVQVSTKISRQVEDPVPAEPHKLQEIDGIGEKRAQALLDGGIDSLEDLIAADPDDVARLLGPPTTAEYVRVWQEQAKRLLEG